MSEAILSEEEFKTCLARTMQTRHPEEREPCVERLLATDAALRARVEEPNAEMLRAWADWFDNPNRSPAIVLALPVERYTAGMLLREIASALAAAPPASEGEED